MQVHQKLFTVFKLGWCFSWFAHPFKKRHTTTTTIITTTIIITTAATTTTTTTTNNNNNNNNNSLQAKPGNMFSLTCFFLNSPEQLLSQSCEVLFHICWFRLFDLSLCSSIPQLENQGTKRKLDIKTGRKAPSKPQTSVTLLSLSYIYICVINIVRKHW